MQNKKILLPVQVERAGQLPNVPLLCLLSFFLFGLQGNCRPSDDEITKQTWLEPEQRPRKRVPKRSVHGKQPPRGESKTYLHQDDQP